MSPRTEPLIRDYLNRISVAAQGRLNRDDRRALLERTRGYIEHATGMSGPATAKEVAAVLSRLGDPTLVVAKEMERLAEVRGGPGAPPPAPRRARLARPGSRAPGRLGASWHLPVRPGNATDLHAMLAFGRPVAEAASGRDTESRNTGRRAARHAQAAASQPAPDGSVIPASGLEALGLIGADRDDAGLAGPNGLTPESVTDQPAAGTPAATAMAAGPQRPSWPHDPAIGRDHATPGRPQQNPQAPTAGTSPAAEASAAVGVPGGEAPEGFLATEPALQPAAGAERVDPTSSGDVRGDTSQLTAVDPQVTDVTAAQGADSQPVRPSGLRRMSTAVIAWSRDNTLESVATILLGVGGLIFPPIWLLGAMIALASKIWDGRDKWVGLAIPLLLTIVGTAAGVILAGRPSSLGHDVHVGWVSAGIASRISAVLGAAYLAWRSVRGRRPEAVPPWNKQDGAG